MLVTPIGDNLARVGRTLLSAAFDVDSKLGILLPLAFCPNEWEPRNQTG